MCDKYEEEKSLQHLRTTICQVHPCQSLRLMPPGGLLFTYPVSVGSCCPQCPLQTLFSHLAVTSCVPCLELSDGFQVPSNLHGAVDHITTHTTGLQPRPTWQAHRAPGPLLLLQAHHLQTPTCSPRPFKHPPYTAIPPACFPKGQGYHVYKPNGVTNSQEGTTEKRIHVQMGTLDATVESCSHCRPV